MHKSILAESNTLAAECQEEVFFLIFHKIYKEGAYERKSSNFFFHPH